MAASKGGRPKKPKKPPSREPKRGKRMYVVLPLDLYESLTVEARELGSQRSSWQHVLVARLRERDTLKAENKRLIDRLTERSLPLPQEPHAP